MNDLQMESLIRISNRRRYSVDEVEYWARRLMEKSEDARDMYLATFDIIYFAQRCVKIYDSVTNSWIPFLLWPIQQKMIEIMKLDKKSVHLKVRQYGATWGALTVALHDAWTKPLSRILITSKTDDLAVELLSRDRLRGMLSRLPDWVKFQLGEEEGNLHKIPFANQSVIHGLNPKKGDSFTSTLAIIDEADLIEDLDDLVNKRLSPTIEAGGRLILLSRAEKTQPQSEFKRIYRAAKKGEADYTPFFMGWRDHPNLSEEWYENKRRELLAVHGNLDILYEQYPETDEQALAPNTADKRIIFEHLEKCFEADAKELPMPDGNEGLYGVKIYEYVDKNKSYFIGVDSAEGLPASDNSAIFVIDENGHEVANCVGKYSPESQAAMLLEIADYYNGALCMIENNFHGYTVITEVLNNGRGDLVLENYDGSKLGWNSTLYGKKILYDRLAESIHNHEAKIRDYDCFVEVQGITKTKLVAPDNMADDRADAYALAHAARIFGGALGEVFVAKS